MLRSGGGRTVGNIRISVFGANLNIEKIGKVEKNAFTINIAKKYYYYQNQNYFIVIVQQSTTKFELAALETVQKTNRN